MPDPGALTAEAPGPNAAARRGAVTIAESTPVRLKWLPPPETAEGAVTKYRVYYRPFLPSLVVDGKWVLLREIPASANPGTVVNAGDIPTGTYEIAVSSVGPGGESALHQSTDITASPSTGWYLGLKTGK